MITDRFRTNVQAGNEVVVLDPELTRAAARGIGYTGSLNMTLNEARDLGAAMATDYYIVGDAQTLRRSSSAEPMFFESYCSFFIVAARTGALVSWDRLSFKNVNKTGAENALVNELGAKHLRQRILSSVKDFEDNSRQQRDEPIAADAIIEEAPNDELAAVEKGLRLPRAYQRLRPDYPETAAEADVEATVDILADIGADGEVSQVRVVKWAGFGLDEASIRIVKQLHFFPAMRNGVRIPMRVLLRYNFRKPNQ
ncbi:MAG: energy transducer TonB [Pyrinomonadaceae bacterium]